MKTKHTPGLWEEEIFHNGIHIWAGAKKVCSIWFALFTNKEAKANAKLIAAAPELLEALDKLRISVGNNCNDMNPWLEEAYQNAVNTIKKATS